MSDSEVICDVLVAGGGPAGATAAALLAAQGRKVTLVEKDRHPRFHIGESLLPMNMELLDRLGVSGQVAKVGMPKYGVEFVSPYHNKTTLLEFSGSWDKRFESAYQVRRADFDEILIRNAATKGAEVIEGCRIESVEFLADGGARVTGTDDAGQARAWRTRFLVDATGRDTLLANRLSLKQRNRRHNSAAIYGHFTGAKRLAGRQEGNITIFWFDHGWFWFIPLADGTTSIGAVCRPEFLKTRGGTDVTAFFHQLIAMSPELSRRLSGAELNGPAHATGNYSYKSERMTGRNYIMLGDAFAFIDPVFSTGVYLAMRSAFMGAQTIGECLDQPARADRALARFDREVRSGIDTFSWYIYRITRPAMRNLLMNPRNYFRVEEAVLSLLSGDVDRHSPIRPRLAVFKAFYYVNCVALKLKGIFQTRSAAGPMAAPAT